MLRTAFTVLLLGLTIAGTALAGDITGTWSGSMTMGDNQFTLTYNFKQDGEKLTGSVTGPGGNAIDLNEGTVKGDKISFLLKVDTPNGSMKITNEGTVKGADEITLTSTMEGGPGAMPAITLKRSK